MEPRYENYSKQQLNDVLRVIDREKHPGRYYKVVELLKTRPSESEKIEVSKNSDAKKLTSPLQVFVGSYWGGPIYTIYAIRKNFLALGDKARATKAIQIGVFAVLALLAIMPFIPENIPNVLIPAIYGAIGKLLVEKYQLKKDAIANSSNFIFESNWAVFGKATLALLLFLGLIMVTLFVFLQIGLVGTL